MPQTSNNSTYDVKNHNAFFFSIVSPFSANPRSIEFTYCTILNPASPIQDIVCRSQRHPFNIVGQMRDFDTSCWPKVLKSPWLSYQREQKRILGGTLSQYCIFQIMWVIPSDDPCLSHTFHVVSKLSTLCFWKFLNERGVLNKWHQQDSACDMCNFASGVNFVSAHWLLSCLIFCRSSIR